MRRFPIALAAALLSALPANAADASTVLAAPRQRVQSADFRATGHLVRVEDNGNRISLPITIKAHWFPGVLRVLVEIGAVSKTGAKSLLSDQIYTHILLEMRPNGQNVVRIAHPGDKEAAMLPFSKWSDGPLGPGFSYEDFLEPEYFWPNQVLVEQTRYGARDCDLLNSTPGSSDRTHYTQYRSWLDHGIGFPVYVEKTVSGTGAVKEFTYFDLRQTGGVWWAHQVEVKLRGSAGSTLLIIDRGSAKAKLGLADFSTGHLTAF